MFTGHLGAGLILKRADKTIGLGVLFFGSLLLDIVLWLLVLVRVESVRAPPEFRRMTDLAFDFPYSHSLVAAIAWSLAALVVACVFWRGEPQRGIRAPLVLVAAVFAHFVLDWLVHIPELPLLGNNSPKIGLGLWRHPTLAWSIEAFLATGGVWSYLSLKRTGRIRLIALIAVMTVLSIMTIAGQATQSSAPTPTVMAISSLATIALVVTFGWWVDPKGEHLRAGTCPKP